MEKEEIIHTQKSFIRWQITIIVLLVALIGVFLYLRSPKSNTPVIQKSNLSIGTATTPTDFPYLDPDVNINLNQHYIINFKPLEEIFQTIQSKYSQKTYIYFDYLNNNLWIGSNNTIPFLAASSVKVPLAMAILKMVEDGNFSLSQKYTLAELNLDSNFGTLYKVGANNSFTLGQLLQIMLVNSDNTAMNALYTAMKLDGVNDPFHNVYTSMGWQYETTDNKIPSYQKIDMDTLSNMFIALYEGTYDTPQDSNMILKYLDDSDFNNAIVAGVPESVGVSHKIGMDDTDMTYRDCGIVYAPQRNYILCVGSAGASQDVANQFMSEISKAAYDFVTNN